MAYSDLRGAQYDLDVTASVGVYETVTVEDNGSAYDLSSTTISVVLKDDTDQQRAYGGEYGTETTIPQTVTNAASGIFTFSIPPANFTNKEGGRLTYEMYFTEGGNRTGRMWGYINVQERG